MTEYHCDPIREKNGRWDLEFARQSTLNGAKALSFEMNLALGSTAPEHFKSCQLFFADSVSRRNLSNVNLGAIFEPLCHALTFKRFGDSTAEVAGVRG